MVNEVKYKWRLIGMDEDWVPETSQSQAVYTNLSPGEYTFEVVASNQDGVWSSPVTFHFKILTPFWQRIWFIALVLLLIIGIISLLVKARINQLKANQKRLELLVEEKTLEVRQQNDEIMTQNEELFQQQEEIKAQRDAIQYKNIELNKQNTFINTSIEAAKTIQQAVLPFPNRMCEVLGEHFVIFRPRDIVSGDFYWMQKIDGKIFLVVADCTGHGVPGAFMSMIGSTLLDKIIQVEKYIEPAKILHQLHLQVNTALEQEDTGNNNGMDLALIVMEKKPNGVTDIVFSGAKRPLYYYDVQKQQIETIRGCRKSIGGYQNKDKNFINHQISLDKGSFVYLGSDGFEDQNDVKRKKFGEKNLLSLPEKIVYLPLDEQRKILDTSLNKHMKDTSQRDDILFMGIKL